MCRRVIAVVALVSLSGCASVNWERAFYEGQRTTAAQCRLHPQQPGEPPCATLPGHAEYERERAGARRVPGADSAQPADASLR